MARRGGDPRVLGDTLSAHHLVLMTPLADRRNAWRSRPRSVHPGRSGPRCGDGAGRATTGPAVRPARARRHRRRQRGDRDLCSTPARRRAARPAVPMGDRELPRPILALLSGRFDIAENLIVQAPHADRPTLRPTSTTSIRSTTPSCSCPCAPSRAGSAELEDIVIARVAAQYPQPGGLALRYLPYLHAELGAPEAARAEFEAPRRAPTSPTSRATRSGCRSSRCLLPGSARRLGDARRAATLSTTCCSPRSPTATWCSATRCPATAPPAATSAILAGRARGSGSCAEAPLRRRARDARARWGHAPVAVARTPVSPAPRRRSTRRQARATRPARAGCSPTRSLLADALGMGVLAERARGLVPAGPGGPGGARARP